MSDRPEKFLSPLTQIWVSLIESNSFHKKMDKKRVRRRGEFFSIRSTQIWVNRKIPGKVNQTTQIWVDLIEKNSPPRLTRFLSIFLWKEFDSIRLTQIWVSGLRKIFVFRIKLNDRKKINKS
jgi:hypothetical protein